jgi:DNA-binding transcriptional regulator YiaG
MSPDDVRDARKALGVSQAGLAELLRAGKNGDRQVRRWEDGDLTVSGPASVAIEALLSGWRPACEIDPEK